MISTQWTRFTLAAFLLAASFFFLAEPSAFAQTQSSERARQHLGLADDDTDAGSLYANFRLRGSLDIAAWNPMSQRKLAGEAMREHAEREVSATDDPILVKAFVAS